MDCHMAVVAQGAAVLIKRVLVFDGLVILTEERVPPHMMAIQGWFGAPAFRATPDI